MVVTGNWHVVLLTFVSGYHVEKGTIIFINNYEINNSEKYWDAPSEFRPERFIADGKVTRPDYFIPFSTGKRTCIGQRLVQGFSFLLVSTILQHFDVTADPSSIRIYPACIAVPPDTFSLTFSPRNFDSVHSNWMSPSSCNSMPNMYIYFKSITAKSCLWTTCNIYTYIYIYIYIVLKILD